MPLTFHDPSRLFSAGGDGLANYIRRLAIYLADLYEHLDEQPEVTGGPDGPMTYLGALLDDLERSGLEEDVQVTHDLDLIAGAWCQVISLTRDGATISANIIFYGEPSILFGDVSLKCVFFSIN